MTLIKNNGPAHLETYYFAYGSNLNLEQMQGRCPDCEPIAPAIAWGYELTFKGSSGYGVADIQPKDDDFVPGAIYKVSEADRDELDSYEGYPRLYDRHVIQVVRKDTGEVVEAFVYRMLNHYKQTTPGQWYFSIIRDGYWDWDMGAYIDRLEQARFAYERIRLGIDLRKKNA